MCILNILNRVTVCFHEVDLCYELNVCLYDLPSGIEFCIPLTYFGLAYLWIGIKQFRLGRMADGPCFFDDTLKLFGYWDSVYECCFNSTQKNAYHIFLVPPYLIKERV